MTLEEKTIELQSQFPPLKVEQIIEILKNFTPDEKVVDEVEETSTEQVASETEVTSNEQVPEAGNQDSSIAPDPVVEQTNNAGSDPLDSGDGELPFQDYKFGEFKVGMSMQAMDATFDFRRKYETVAKQSEVYNPENDPFQYKFEVTPEGKFKYLYKGPNDKDFVVQEDAYASSKIAQKLKHLDKNQLENLSKYENSLDKQRQEIKMISSLPSFDEKMEFLEIGSYDAKAKDILAKVAEIDSALSNFGTEKVTKTEKTLFQYQDPKTGEFKNEKTTVEDQTVINSKQGENYFNKLVELRKKLTEELKKEFAENPLYNKQAEKEAEKLVAEMGFLGRLENGIQKGSVTLGESIASIPATIYDIAARFTDPVMSALTGKEVVSTSKKFTESLGLSNPILDYYIAEGEKLEAINEAYDKANYKVQGVAANFAAGRYLDAVKQLGTGLGESMPVSISMMLGGGYMKAGQFIAGGTLAFAGPEIREMRENNPAMSEFEVITDSLALAAAETVFGFVGKGSIGRTYRTILAKEGKEKGVQVFKKGLIDMYETAIKKYGAIAGTLGEGIEEVATQITQNLIKGIDPFTGVPDAFLLGVGGGGLYTSPVNVAQAVGNVKSGITNRKIDNILTKNNLVSINEAFDGLDVGDGIQGITPVQIDLLKVKGSLQAVNARVDKQLSAGDITEAQANSIKQKATNVQGANNVLSALDVTTNQTELTALLIEQKNLKNKIKQVDNSSLTKAESEKLNEVETQLGELITQDRNLKNIEGAKAFAEGLEGVGLENVKGTEDLISSVEAIEANGGEVIGLAKDKDGNILPAEDQNYGFISRMSDGTTQVILNEVSALKDNVATTAQHEVLHALLDKIFVNNDSAKIEAGKKLETLLNSDGIELDALVANRLNTASQQLKDGDISEAQYYEEVFTLTSEGLSNDQIVENKTLLDKFTDFGRTLKSIFSGGKLNISFRTGRSALDFVKGYNKAIKSGKGADVAAKTGTIKGTEVTEQGKARTSERIYQKVESLKDKLVDPNTKEETAFEIANDPAMFNEIDRRLKFDADAIAREDVIRNFLYDDARGMLGLLKGYDPARNDSIMGYLNSSTAGGKLLDARLFEFFKNDPRYERIIQSTTDENIQRKIESKTTGGKKTTTKPKARARTTPKASRKYPSTILSNLGVSTKAEVDALFEEAIADDIANFYKGEIKEFKDIKDIGPAVAALMEKATGLKANRFSKKNQNIMKGDVVSGAVTALQQLLNANADADFAMLAEAANIEGKSTSIPGKILEALFTKNSKDKYVRDTRKGLRDYKNIIDALNLEAKVKKGKDAIYRSADAQALKGLANLSLRNLIFEQAVPDPVARTRTGARFSNKIIKEAVNEVENKGAKKFLEKTLSGNLDADAVEAEINFIEDTAKTLGVDFTDAVDYLFTNEKRYKELRSKFNVRVGGKNEISSVANAAKLKKGYTSLIKGMIPKGKSFSDLPVSFQMALMKTVGFGDARIKIGGKPFTLQEYGLKRGEYGKLMQAVFGKDALIGTGTNLGTRDNVYAPSNWGEKGFRGKVEKIADSYNNGDITLDEARAKVEDLLTPDKETNIDDVLIANQRAVSDTYVSLINMFAADPTSENFATIIDILESQVNRATGIFKGLIPVTSFSIKPEKGTTKGKTANKRMHNEHLVELFNANKNFLNILDKLRKGKITKEKAIFDAKVNAASLEQAVISERMRVEKDADGASVRSFANPLTFLGKDAQFQIPIGIRRLPSGRIFTGTNLAEFIAQELSEKQAKIISTASDASLSPEGIIVKNMINNKSIYQGAKKQNTEMMPGPLGYARASQKQKTNQDIVGELSNLDQALNEGRKIDKPVRKIRVFDFDDTLARSNSMIIVNLPEQVQKITRTGDSVKVINTVYKGVVDLIAANNKIKSINFSSEASEPSRVRLYNTLANKLKKDLGWDLDLFETTFLDEKQTDDFTLTKPTKQTSIKKLKSNLNFTEDIAGNFKTSFKIKNKKYNVALDKKGKGDYELNFSLVGEGTGKTFKINATQFAEQAADLEAQGAKFDFAQFSKVVDGKKGPLFDVAKKIADKRGTEDLFILTARPQDAAGPIKAFMKALGIDIPLKNITGLGDGTAAAKGRWIAGKAAEGYNDFYFADDAVKNVQAVKDTLQQFDVKRKVQRAIPSTIKQKVKFSRSSLKKTINSPQYKKFKNNIKDRVLYHGGSETINTIRDNNAVWFYLDDAEAAQMWGDGEVYSVKASDIQDMVVLPDLNDVGMFTNHLQEKFNLEQKLYDIRDILKHPKADEMIAEWMDWSSKNDMTYDIGYNLYEKQNVTNGAAVTVLGVIPKNKIQQVSSKSSKKSLRGNQAVKDVLSQIDVKSKVQQARASKKKTFDTVVNDMIQDSSGIESFKQFSAAKAKTVGRDKGRFDWLTMASSAEDFKGLLYSLLGNGKKGESQYEFLKTNLIDPYNKAEDSITQAKIAAANDFMALKEQFPGLPKTLETETGVGKFTYQHALRTYMWTQQGMSIPGLSKTDVKKLNNFIKDDAKLQAFADQLISIQKGKPYPKPGKDWLGGNLTTDIIGGINDVNRKEYQQEWQENVDIIFSPENLNKMEAAYGTRWRKSLENTLTRMKAGTNRLGYNDQTSAVLDWVNNSVGAVMFLNTRSALLQTISAVNFINWGDNNIIAAGKAFANQKQFWGDFMTLMNSDYLTQRRNGLKINVSESEIADAVKDSKNKVKSAIAFLLSKGFVLTRYADSFAIASGGATFYRNRLNKYIKEGMSKELATEKAFQDFRLVAEESQQSSSPDKISMQQASAAGRVILNWANTPMQYVRIQKRSIQDLIAGRGDAKTHISRIAYYGVMQNLIFNALQQALFAIGFGDDDEDEEKSAAKKKQDDKKIARVANGMIDSQLKGLGIAGMGMVAAKNSLMKIYEESGKQRPEYEKAAIEALSFSPAISSKYRKIVGGLKSFSWNMKEIKEKGFSLDNPAYLAGAQIITATTNIPIDRVIKKANNIRGIMSEQSQMWQKVSMALGWSSYDVGLPYYGGWDKPVEPTPAELKRQEIDVMKKNTSTADQTQMLLDLGLDKKQIKALRYEDARVKKIIELQNKKKKDAGSQK